MSDCDDKFQLDKDSAETALNSHPAESASINTPRLNTLLDSQGRPVDENEEDAAPILETPQDRRMRKRSHYIVYLTCFIVSLGFSIVLTGVWPYMKKLDHGASKEFLGWVIAANPFGQMLASPLLGLWANKLGSNRWPFIVTIIFFIFGNILYGILPLTKPYSDYFLLLSRFIVGLSSGNIAICRSYIVSASKFRERTAALSFVAAAQSLGFILGPSIQAALAYFGTPSESPPGNNTSTDLINSFNEDTSIDTFGIFNPFALAGWASALLGLVNLVILLPCIFKEFNFAKYEATIIQSKSSSISNDSCAPDYFALIVHLCGFFIIVLSFIILETLAVPAVLDMYAWTDVYSVKFLGVTFTIMGVISIFMFPLGSRLAGRFGERKIFVLLGLLPLALGVLILLPVGNNYPKIKYCGSNSSSNSLTLEESFDDFLNTSNSREKRAIILPDDDCNELGCSYKQSWCFTTPIIEFPQVFISFSLSSIGYPVAFALAGAIYSKMLGFKPQATWMGVLTGVGGLSRVIGPIVFTYIYTYYGPFWTISLHAFLALLAFLLNLLIYRRLAPLHSEMKVEMKAVNGAANS